MGHAELVTGFRSSTFAFVLGRSRPADPDFASAGTGLAAFRHPLLLGERQMDRAGHGPGGRWSGLLMPQFLSSYREKRQVGRNHDTDFDGSSVVLHGDALHTAP